MAACLPHPSEPPDVHILVANKYKLSPIFVRGSDLEVAIASELGYDVSWLRVPSGGYEASSLWSHFTNIVHGKAKRHCRGLSSPDATKDIFRDLFSKDQHLPDPSSFFYFCHYSKSSKSISCHASSDWQFPSMGYSLLELQPTPFNTSNTLSRLPGGLFLCETVHHVFRRFERYYNIHFALSVRVLRREWVLYKKVFYMKLQIYKTYGSLTCWWPKLYSRQFHYLLWLVKSVTLD